MIVNSKREIIQVFFRKFRIVSVSFETVLFVSVVSIQVRNTETNRKRKVLVSRNKPKQTRNRSCFGLFRFEPKIFIFHFEDTLLHEVHPPKEKMERRHSKTASAPLPVKLLGRHPLRDSEEGHKVHPRQIQNQRRCCILLHKKEDTQFIFNVTTTFDYIRMNNEAALEY